MPNYSCTKYGLAGMGQECSGAVAGLKALYIGLQREWTVAEDKSENAAPHSVTITAASGADNPKFYPYYIMDESSSLTSTLTINAQNGVKYYTNTVNATFVRMRPEKHIELMALANEKLVVIAVDNNDQNWVLGMGSAVTASEETAQSGQAFDDLSGYQITLSQRSAALPYVVKTLPAIDQIEVYE